MADVLLSETPAPTVRLLTLNRPDRLNAMTSELCSALHAELEAIVADRSCRAVVLTGAGRGFCAGLDLQATATRPVTTAATPPATGSATRSTCRA